VSSTARVNNNARNLRNNTEADNEKNTFSIKHSIVSNLDGEVIAFGSSIASLLSFMMEI
jgi:hypothetical protein